MKKCEALTVAAFIVVARTPATGQLDEIGQLLLAKIFARVIEQAIVRE